MRMFFKRNQNEKSNVFEKNNSFSCLGKKSIFPTVHRLKIISPGSDGDVVTRMSLIIIVGIIDCIITQNSIATLISRPNEYYVWKHVH